MNLYKYLKETTLLDELKTTIIPSLHEVQSEIERYSFAEEDEYMSILSKIQDNLNTVIEVFDNLGYDYEPEVEPDVSDSTFSNMLIRFKDQISNFISHFDSDNMYSFNASVRKINNTIDVHKTNFIKEGEVLHESWNFLKISKNLEEAIEKHDDLNPKIWNTNMTMKEEVLADLQAIADEFLNYIEIPLNVVDIEVVGSNASYNYNDKSDIDLHIIVNNEVNYVDPEILQQLYNSKKNSFNEAYDLSIKDIPVELYVEDIKSGNATNGRFSILKNEWIKVPKPITYDIPDIEKELNEYKDKCEKTLKSEDPEEIMDLINEIYMMRKLGLSEGGEASVGNLVFKELRNEDYQSKLRERYYELKSNELSIR